MRGFRSVLVLAAAAAMGVLPLAAEEPGWHYSPPPGEGDRAALGCDRAAAPAAITCLAVRCEADFSVGVHVHSTRQKGALGPWEMTLDRENRVAVAEPADAPYGGRFIADADWLLEGLRQGSFIYLRHVDDVDAPFAFIDLGGSLRAIHQALALCAPRRPASEPISAPGVEPEPNEENNHGPSSPRTQ